MSKSCKYSHAHNQELHLPKCTGCRQITSSPVYTFFIFVALLQTTARSFLLTEGISDSINLASRHSSNTLCRAISYIFFFYFESHPKGMRNLCLYATQTQQYFSLSGRSFCVVLVFDQCHRSSPEGLLAEQGRYLGATTLSAVSGCVL